MKLLFTYEKTYMRNFYLKQKWNILLRYCLCSTPQWVEN